MKLIQSVFIAVGALAACSALSSCSHSHDPRPVVPDGTLVDVNFTLAGEFVNITEEPLARADGETKKKYYAINVLRSNIGEADYSYIAYGVFDNLSDMHIALETGYEYKFECTTVQDDVDILATVETGSFEHYMLPFSLAKSETASDGTKVSYYRVSNLNTFCSEAGNYLNGLGTGKSTVESSNADGREDLLYPRLVRYYGALEGFNPTVATEATINLKSATFGVKVVVEDMPGGTLTWKDAYGTLDFGEVSLTGSGRQEATTKFTLDKVKSVITANSDEVSTDILFTWQPDGGMEKKYMAEVTLKRNIMTVIKVELSSYDKNITLGIVEEAPMTEETVPANPL